MGELTRESPSARAKRNLNNVVAFFAAAKWEDERQVGAFGGPGIPDSVLTVADLKVLNALVNDKTRGRS